MIKGMEPNQTIKENFTFAGDLKGDSEGWLRYDRTAE